MMKNLSLYFIYSFIILCTGKTIAQTNSVINLTGHWTWSDKTSSLELNLYQNGNDITGTYCAIAQSGNRIDCSDDEPSKCLISGKLINNSAKLAFASCYSNRIDSATLTYNPRNKRLKWEFTQTDPGMNIPVPTEAILTKENSDVAPMPDLLRTAQNIIETIHKKDFSALTTYFHPINGVRFSPYAYVDTTSDQILKSIEFSKAFQKGNKITWGAYEGNADPIDLDIKTYFNKFIYDADFAHATAKSINMEIGTSTTVNNIRDIYPDSDFIEYYSEKTDTNNEIVKWRSLRLIFKNYKNQYNLTGIVHDGVH